MKRNEEVANRLEGRVPGTVIYLAKPFFLRPLLFFYNTPYCVGSSHVTCSGCKSFFSHGCCSFAFQENADAKLSACCH